MAGQSPAGFKGLLLISFLFLSVVQCRLVTDLDSVQASNGLRIDLVHRDSFDSNVTPTERLRRAVERSQMRLDRLHMSSVLTTDEFGFETKDVQVPVYSGSGEFLMKVAIGTPNISMSSVMDTGSDLIWTQCKPCVDCYKQPTPIYDPSSSSTYSKVPCSSPLCQGFSCHQTECTYDYNYNDYSFTKGVLSYETFTLSSKSLPNIAFGCSHDSEGHGFGAGTGIIGFGRGPLSLNSQLGKTTGNKFSYCLVGGSPSPSKSSPLFVGQTAILSGNDVQSTPILQSKANPSSYYLSLKGISVGNQSLDIAPGTFDLQNDGSGGVIIDSGSTITYLPENAYEAVFNALSSIHLQQTDGSPFSLDLCFKENLDAVSLNAKFPAIDFHFEGATYRVNQRNYMLNFQGDTVCLAMLPSSSGSTILGNVLQQNYHIHYDLEKNVLSFQRTVCSTL